MDHGFPKMYKEMSINSVHDKKYQETPANETTETKHFYGVGFPQRLRLEGLATEVAPISPWRSFDGEETAVLPVLWGKPPRVFGNLREPLEHTGH